MPASNLALDGELDTRFSVTAQALRRWCAPAAILAITDLADEEKLLFHAIQQALPGRAKVLLARVFAGVRSVHGRGKALPAESCGVVETARTALDRMARQLRWVGIPCDPVLLRGATAEAIAHLVRAQRVDRILLTVPDGEHPHSPRQELLEKLLRSIEIPLCTLGRRMPPRPQSEAPARRITLALFLDSDCGVPLAFASRLAQEQRAKLTVVYVARHGERKTPQRDLKPVGLDSRLPMRALREAELLCPVEIAVRQGDLAAEILGHSNSERQDFIVIGPVSPSSPDPSCAAAVRKIVSGAPCPVMLLGDSIAHSAAYWSMEVEVGIPPYGFHH